jgi:DNA-binding transcriptional LysR family regulator
MDIIASMRVFTTVVSTGSFAGAAEKLGLSRGMATRHVAQLEERLGLRLLNRTTRKLSLTEAGADYHERTLQILALLDEAESAAEEHAGSPRGTLRLATSVGLGVLGMGRIIAAFLTKYPELKVDLVLSDRVVDLVEEGFDLAIRMGPKVDPGLIARKISDVALIVCASPAYLQRRGVPRRPRDLGSHDCLTYAYSTQETEWPFAQDGVEEKVRVAGSFRANNGNVLTNAAIEGLGIVRQPRYLVADALDQGRLVRLLPTWDAGSHTVNAVYPSRQFLPAKVRALIDFLVQQFQGDEGQ